MVAWDTKVEDSTTARLRAGLGVPLGQAAGLVDLVGTVLLVGVQVSAAPLEVVVLVVSAVTEDISSGRAQEDLTTETLSGRDSRCFCNCTPPGATVSGWYDSLFSFSLSFLALLRFVSIAGWAVVACQYQRQV